MGLHQNRRTAAALELTGQAQQGRSKSECEPCVGAVFGWVGFVGVAECCSTECGRVEVGWVDQPVCGKDTVALFGERAEDVVFEPFMGDHRDNGALDFSDECPPSSQA